MDGDTLRIALAQMDVMAGQPTKNLDAMASAIASARDAGADLVVFPELCLGGRFLADRWNDLDFIDYLDSFNDRVRDLSEGIGVIFGNVTRSYLLPPHPGRDGRPARYNAALFAHDGKWVPREDGAPEGRYVKTQRPDRLAFDDERHFTSSIEDAAHYPGRDLEETWLAPFAFEKDGRTFRIGLQVCEDLWSDDRVVDVTERYARARCDLIVNIAASPWIMGRDRAHAERMREHAGRAGGIPPVVHVNAVGMQDAGKSILSLDGGSAVYRRDGSRACGCRDDFQEELAIVAISNGEPVPDGDAPADAGSYAGEAEKTLDAIVSALRRFDGQVFPFRPKWIIGLSGGIDSSITAALLSMALGDPARIVGYNLATRYNSDATKMNAYALAEALGIRLVNGSIERAIEATEEVMRSYGYPEGSTGGLVQENIQARLRGHMLSTFAAVEGGVIMNNGNKVEVALGYATLYGDAIGAISPIGDLTKVRLFGLARLVNDAFGREVVPSNLVPVEDDRGFSWETMPSAELREAQRDPMKWFYHDWLVERLMAYPGFGVEEVMEEYLEDRLLASDVAKWVRFYGLDDPERFIEDLEWVLAQLSKSVFKRIQMPPSITVTRSSFGAGFRENQVSCEQTDRYRELRGRILSLR